MPSRIGSSPSVLAPAARPAPLYLVLTMRNVSPSVSHVASRQLHGPHRRREAVSTEPAAQDAHTHARLQGILGGNGHAGTWAGMAGQGSWIRDKTQLPVTWGAVGDGVLKGKGGGGGCSFVVLEEDEFLSS